MVKKCPKCGAVWYSELPKCAFCGVEGELQPMSTHTGRLPEKPAPAPVPAPVPELKPERPISETAVAEATPIPPTSADGVRPAVKMEEKPAVEVVPAPPAPVPAPVVETKPVVEAKAPAPVPVPRTELKPLAPGEKKPDVATLPPAPRVPSSKLPVLLALLGVLACVMLPIAVFMHLERIPTIMAYLAGSILLPLAPLSWFMGRRYEDRCIDLGFKPATFGKIGRLLGMTVTILISLEGSVLAFLAALKLISEK